MWQTERGQKLIQLAFLFALGYVASFDVGRTMQQKPMTAEQSAAIGAMLNQQKSVAER